MITIAVWIPTAAASVPVRRLVGDDFALPPEGVELPVLGAAPAPAARPVDESPSLPARQERRAPR